MSDTAKQSTMSLIKVKPMSFLRRAIIAKYLKDITSELEINKHILASDWASSGSEFHKECRADMENDCVTIKNQIKFLSPPSDKRGK